MDIIDLNILITGSADWDYLYAAYAINNEGSIVGIGYRDNNLHGFLMIPTTVVPEPTSSILFVTGFVTGGALLAGRSYIKRRKRA